MADRSVEPSLVTVPTFSAHFYGLTADGWIADRRLCPWIRHNGHWNLLSSSSGALQHERGSSLWWQHEHCTNNRGWKYRLLPHTNQKDLTDRSQISFRLLLNIGDTTACWYCIGIEGWGRVSVQNEARLHANKPTPKSSQQNYNIQ